MPLIYSDDQLARKLYMPSAYGKHTIFAPNASHQPDDVRLAHRTASK